MLPNILSKALCACAAALLVFSGPAAAAPKAKAIEFWDDFEPTSQLRIDNSAWQKVLDKYLDANHPSGINRVNYAAVSAADKASLRTYIAMMQSMDPRQLQRQRAKAYWLNLFNASVVYQIIDRQPKESIRNLGRRFWRIDRFYISMQDMSLDDIQHGVLRPIFDDPRVHFGVIAGNISSASLPTQVFTGENVDELLEANTRAFLNHRRAATTSGDDLMLSTTFKWYQEDFGGSLAEVKSFINQYVEPEKAIKIIRTTQVSYEYDWELNKP